MKKKLLMFVLILVLVFSSFVFVNVYADTKPITWIAQSCFPIQLPLSRFAIVLWAEKVEAMSGGRLVIELHSSGEIVPGTGVFEAVRDGVLDCGQNTPAWQKGLYPAGDLFYTLPGGITEYHDLMIWMYSGEGIQLEHEMYNGEIVAFPLGLTPPEELWTNKPINSLKDMEGLKVRSAGLSMELWEKLGCSVVLLPGGEVVPSLQRGVVDAAEFCDPSMDYSLGLPDVAKFLIGPPVHMGSNMFQLLINNKSWNELPNDLKEIVKTAAVAATLEGYAKHWMEAIDAFKKISDAGITIMKLSPEAQAEAKKLSFEILDEKSKEDPYFSKVWNSQKNFLELYKPFHEFSKFD